MSLFTITATAVTDQSYGGRPHIALEVRDVRNNKLTSGLDNVMDDVPLPSRVVTPDQLDAVLEAAGWLRTSGWIDGDGGSRADVVPSPTRPNLLREIEQARDDLESADQSVKQWEGFLDLARQHADVAYAVRNLLIAAAVKAGEQKTEIAACAGVSRVRVYQIADETSVRSSASPRRPAAEGPGTTPPMTG